VRVAIDGSPPSRPGVVADALVGPLQVLGHPVARVSAADFVRPASVRLERGRRDPDALYELGIDVSGLVRELLQPLGPAGSGRYLPSLWNRERDRATRATYRTLAPAGVLVLDGSLLLRPELRVELDVTVHLHVGRSALARRTPPERHWMLPAYERYEVEVRPAEVADVVVMADDPGRPAVIVR
jgi:hypothetical protein